MWAATFNLLEVCKAHTTPNTVRVYLLLLKLKIFRSSGTQITPIKKLERSSGVPRELVPTLPLEGYRLNDPTLTEQTASRHNS